MLLQQEAGVVVADAGEVPESEMHRTVRLKNGIDMHDLRHNEGIQFEVETPDEAEQRKSQLMAHTYVHPLTYHSTHSHMAAPTISSTLSSTHSHMAPATHTWLHPLLAQLMHSSTHSHIPTHSHMAPPTTSSTHI